jgi:hypothetical protein
MKKGTRNAPVVVPMSGTHASSYKPLFMLLPVFAIAMNNFQYFRLPVPAGTNPFDAGQRGKMPKKPSAVSNQHSA